jgi:hypothetical protein
MNNKDIFLRRLFLYDIQSLVSVVVGILVIGLCAVFLILVLGVSEEKGLCFLASVPALIFGLYNLFTYLWSKKLAEKYGIDMFGDLDQRWLIEYQGYDSTVFGEIFEKRLNLKKLGTKSLYITIPLSLTPWPIIPFLAGIVMMIAYAMYSNVYYYSAMGDKWPRVFGAGVVVSRILDNSKGKGEEKKNGK